MRRMLLDCQLELVALTDWGNQTKLNLQIMYTLHGNN